MAAEDYRSVNRANWDERVPAHVASPDYDVQEFVENPRFLSAVVRFDLPRLGEVAGTDPQPGGSAWAYGYPTDPINLLDPDGRRWKWGQRWLRGAHRWTRQGATHVWNHATAGYQVCAVVCGGVGVQAGRPTFSGGSLGLGAGWSIGWARRNWKKTIPW